MTDDRQAKTADRTTAPVLDPIAAYALWADDYPPYAHNPLMQAEERAVLALLPDDLRGALEALGL